MTVLVCPSLRATIPNYRLVLFPTGFCTCTSIIHNIVWKALLQGPLGLIAFTGKFILIIFQTIRFFSHKQVPQDMHPKGIASTVSIESKHRPGVRENDVVRRSVGLRVRLLLEQIKFYLEPKRQLSVAPTFGSRYPHTKLEIRIDKVGRGGLCKKQSPIVDPDDSVTLGTTVQAQRAVWQ